MGSLFSAIDTVDVVAALVVGAGLMALVNFTSFGGRKAASIAR